MNAASAQCNMSSRSCVSSGSNVPYDRNVKRLMYAENQIAEYWIVNLPEAKIEVYTDPTSIGGRSDYRHQITYFAGESIPVVVEGEDFGRIPINEILPDVDLPS